eukprot:Seg2424.1 transcript_id=Seg2424.1/GoldUCD/mRNA.D3Y31 product="hypothetical protein" pseudo=true protein_id=Seg2424.1/GoldUCD/D3Y31
MRSFLSSRQPNKINEEEMEESVNVSESEPEMVDSDDDVIAVADNRCTPPAMATSSGQSADASAANQMTKQQTQLKIEKEHKCTICGKVSGVTVILLISLAGFWSNSDIVSSKRRKVESLIFELSGCNKSFQEEAGLAISKSKQCKLWINAQSLQIAIIDALLFGQEMSPMQQKKPFKLVGFEKRKNLRNTASQAASFHEEESIPAKHDVFPYF